MSKAAPAPVVAAPGMYDFPWTAPANGVYYLVVKHWNPNVGGCGTQYTLSISQSRLYLPLVTK